MYGFIVTADIAATDVVALNEFATSTADVEGGMPVTLGAYANGRYTVSIAAADAKNGTYIAYNPKDVHLMKVNDKLLPSVSIDPRDYANWAGRSFDVFKPQVGDKIGFTAANFNAVPTTTNKNITVGANGKYDSASTAPTAGDMAFELIEIGNQPFPSSTGVGMDNEALYICRCVSN